jgi:tRNA (guanine-N7-)-methyltransferase
MSKRHNPFRHHPPLLCYPSAEDVTAVSILEVGPGRGDFLFELARNNPDKIIAALEIKKKRYYKLIKRIERLKLMNIRLIYGDARVTLPCLFANKQLETIYILFSDPWPKKKHTKHRLFQPYFVHELFRSLRNRGEVVLAHDDERYLNESRGLLLDHSGFSRGEVPSPLQDDNLFDTFYAKKWREAGRELRACRVQKKNLSVPRELIAAARNGWFRFWWWRGKVNETIAAGGARNRLTCGPRVVRK